MHLIRESSHGEFCFVLLIEWKSYSSLWTKNFFHRRLRSMKSFPFQCVCCRYAIVEWFLRTITNICEGVFQFLISGIVPPNKSWYFVYQPQKDGLLIWNIHQIFKSQKGLRPNPENFGWRVEVFPTSLVTSA